MEQQYHHISNIFTDSPRDDAAGCPSTFLPPPFSAHRTLQTSFVRFFSFRGLKRRRGSGGRRPGGRPDRGGVSACALARRHSWREGGAGRCPSLNLWWAARTYDLYRWSFATLVVRMCAVSVPTVAAAHDWPRETWNRRLTQLKSTAEVPKKQEMNQRLGSGGGERGCLLAKRIDTQTTCCPLFFQSKIGGSSHTNLPPFSNKRRLQCVRGGVRSCSDSMGLRTGSSSGLSYRWSFF